MKLIINFFKTQTVLAISFLSALISAFIVTPDIEYFGYININTIILLFCLMAAVAGFQSCGIFSKLSTLLITKSNSIKKLVFVMMNICFFTSMLITNDVALITFVPVTILIFNELKFHSKMPLLLTVIIETVAANLGSMMLPTGNPQNIFLCSNFNLSPLFVIRTLLPFGLLAYILLSISVFLIPKIPLDNDEIKIFEHNNVFEAKKTILSGLIFFVSILTVSGIINEYICLIISIILIFLADKKLFMNVDYFLLLTFICFFIFTGNIGRINFITEFLEKIIKNFELEISILASQIISNVPSAVLLYSFTDKADLLLIGTNLGGLGTPIASLASLISYKLYSKNKNSNNSKYIISFLIYNFVFLIVMYLLAKIIL